MIYYQLSGYELVENYETYQPIREMAMEHGDYMASLQVQTSVDLVANQ